MDPVKELIREKEVTERLLKFLKNEYTKLEDENWMIKDTVDLGISEFEKAMDVFRVHYDGFCMKSEVKEMDFKDLLFRKSVVDGRLKACMMTIDGLVQRNACLEQGRKVGSRAQESENRDLVLGSQSGYWRKRGSELKEQLKVYKARCEELSVKLENKKMECVLVEGKHKELMSTNVVLDGKLKRYKNICYGSEQRIRHLDEERKAKCESDKRVQERIANLEKELKTKEMNEKLKCAELIAVKKDLGSGKERAEDEIKVLMKRLEDLEKGELKQELEAYKNKCHLLSVGLEEGKKEGRLNEAKLKDLMLEKGAVDDELKACKRTCDGLKDLINGLEEDQSLFFKREKKAQERINFLEAEMKKLKSDEGENYSELITKTKDLECAKKGAEDENEILKKRVRDLETRVLRMEQVELEKAELEKEFEKLLTTCEELSMDHVGVEDKRMCNELKEQIMGLEEALKFIREKEKRDQELISYLEEEIKKMESGESEKYVKLNIENRDLEFQKRRAEEEVESWKKRFRELETKVLRLEEEISTLRCVDSQASGGLQSDVSCNDKGIILESETESRTDGAHVDPLKIKEKMLNNSKKILTSSGAGCNHPSSLQGNIDGHMTGPASTVMQSMPLVNVKERIENIPLKFKVDFGSRIRKEHVFELEGSSTKKPALLQQGSVKPASGGRVDINDCDDKHEYVSMDNTSKRSLDNERDLQSKKCLKRPCSDLIGGEYWGTCEEYTPLTSALKTRASKTIRVTEGVHKFPALSTSGGTLSSEGQDVQDSIAPSRRRLSSLRQCEDNRGQRTSRNESSSPYHLQMNGISYQKLGNLISKNGKEHVVDDVPLGDIIGTCSDSSDSGDSSSDSEHATDMELSLDQVISMIKKNKVKESKWQFEADMLSSFEVDSELCMKAVCALYRQQISEEKSKKGSLHSDNRGFNAYDTLRGAALAEFLMDGNRKGCLKKSVKELEMFDPKALDDCKRLARQYSNQLFNIYQNSEDPFFLPGGV